MLREPRLNPFNSVFVLQFTITCLELPQQQVVPLAERVTCALAYVSPLQNTSHCWNHVQPPGCTLTAFRYLSGKDINGSITGQSDQLLRIRTPLNILCTAHAFPQRLSPRLGSLGVLSNRHSTRTAGGQELTCVIP